MAEEILTVEGNDLVREVATELIEEEKKEKKYQKKTVYFQAEFIEGLISETIVQLKNQMDTLFLIFFDEETGNYQSFKGPKKRMDAIKGSLLVFLHELTIVNDCLKPYNKASLNLKHRAVRNIIREGRDRLLGLVEGLEAAKNINNHYVTQFAKEMCLLMTNIHVVFHKDTPRKERNRVVKEYCEGG